MEIKDIKVGDKVKLRKDIPEEELLELLGSYGLIMDNTLELQRRGEVTIEGIQKANLEENDDDWDSVSLVGSNFYWPIELFEPVNKPNKKVIKNKEEQVQEDIQVIKDIVKRYNLKNTMADVANILVRWLERHGQDNLNGKAETGVEGV